MKLNMGCGRDIKKGYINCDVKKLPGVDKIVDLNKAHLPFADDSIDEILCSHTIVFVEDIARTMREFHRILKKGGRLVMHEPHFTYVGSLTDPLVLRFVGYNTFDFFVKSHPLNYYFDFAFSKVTDKNLMFGKKFAKWNYLIEPLANAFPTVYENTCFRAFPAQEMQAVLIK